MTKCIMIQSFKNDNKFYLYVLNDNDEKKYINTLMNNKKIKNDVAYNHFKHVDITQNETFLCDETHEHIFRFIDDIKIDDDDDCKILHEKMITSLNKMHYIVFNSKNHALNHLLNLMIIH